MASGETLLVDRPRAGIAVATLNRPDRLNALTFGMFDELARLAADVGADDGVRVLVLAGAGRGFCAGLDLQDAATLPDMPAARIVGLGHANEILLTGRLVEADEAARIGLVNRVVPAGDLLTSALEVADLIAANSPLGVRLTTQMVQVNVDAPSLEAAVELENRNQTLAAGTQDMVEAFTAFREKRLPAFTGR